MCVDQQGYEFFLSYASVDEPSARALYEGLCQAGKTAFFADETLCGGARWMNEIPKALYASKITVALISPQSNTGFYNNDELATAIDMSRRGHNNHIVVPVLLEGASISQLPLGTAATKCLKKESSGFTSIVRELIRVLEDKKSRTDFASVDHKKNKFVVELLGAFSACKADNIIQMACSEYASLSLPDIWSQVRGVNENDRIEAIIGALFYRANSTQQLTGLVRFVSQALSSKCINTDALRRWLAAKENITNRPIDVAEKAQLNVLRVCIEAYENQFAVKEMWFLNPPMPGLASILSEQLPVLFSQLSELPTVLAPLLKKSYLAMKTFYGHSGQGYNPRNFVMQISVSPEMACYPFEGRSPGSSPILARFKCVAVCPELSSRWPCTMGTAIDNPDAGGNAIAIESPLSQSALVDKMEDFECLFAGSSAWENDGVVAPAVVLAFENHTLSVLCHSSSAKALVESVFRGVSKMGIDVFFDRLRDVRQRSQRLTIFWDDIEYELPSPVSV
jgi:hypothetical protein